MTYEIWIRRWWFFGWKWKKYEAVAHATEILGASARLVVEFPDGTKLAVPRIDRKVVFVYPHG